MSRQLYYLILVGSSLLFVISCKHPYAELPANDGSGSSGGNSTPCDANKIYFQQQVLPILISNCAMSGCHDEATHKEGVVLTSYQKAVTTGGVKPGNAADSKMYKLIIDPDPDDRMPPSPQNPLNAQQIQLIYEWIQQGAKDLVCQNMCDSNSYTYSGAIRPLVQNKCLGCHSGVNTQGGIDLSTYLNVKTMVTNGKLWGSVNQLPGYSPMPKNGTKLSDCELTQIRKWIEGGSPEN